MKRVAAIATVALAGALAWGAVDAPAPLGVLDSPPPTATATPRPFGVTPRATSTALVPRPATPTPRPVTATPGPCTIALTDQTATCKTAYYQLVTWTLKITTTIAEQRTTTSSPLDFTSRTKFAAKLPGTSTITIAPHFQPSRTIHIITLTGEISGSNWISGTTLTGRAPPGSTVTLVHHRWATATNSYRATFYSATTNAQGAWALTVPAPLLHTKRDYWQIRHQAAGVTHVQGVLTRRLYFVVARKQ